MVSHHLVLETIVSKIVQTPSSKYLLFSIFIFNVANPVRNARPNSPTHLNSTLNRPMASQGGTRYEDRTMGRAAHQPHNNGAVQQQSQQYHVNKKLFVTQYME
jgi:hypothetical protein